MSKLGAKKKKEDEAAAARGVAARSIRPISLTPMLHLAAERRARLARNSLAIRAGLVFLVSLLLGAAIVWGFYFVGQ